MTDSTANFSKLVPGFDFLQGLVKNAGAALPSIGQWVAPTLDPQELEKRIEQLRMGDRLRVRWNVADLPMRALVPALTVQPLLENAIGHGVENIDGGGEVIVEGTCSDGIVLLRVRNPMPLDNPHAKAGHGIALDNIRERLSLLFGKASAVTSGREGDEYVVQLRFPETLTSPELMQ